LESLEGFEGEGVRALGDWHLTVVRTFHPWQRFFDMIHAILAFGRVYYGVMMMMRSSGVLLKSWRNGVTILTFIEKCDHGE
jgi:hypothetical protein